MRLRSELKKYYWMIAWKLMGHVLATQMDTTIITHPRLHCHASGRTEGDSRRSGKATIIIEHVQNCRGAAGTI